MKKFCVLGFVLIVVFSLIIAGCKDGGSKPISPAAKEGHALALKYCGTCHQYPGPDLLDKKTWTRYVLPKMSGFLGFKHFESTTYFESGKQPEIMPLKDWQKIVTYYIEQAPENPISGLKKESPGSKLPFFRTEPFPLVKNPVTTYAGIFPDRQEIIFGDGLTEQVWFLSKEFSLTDSFRVNKGISNLFINGKEMAVLSMGVLQPSDSKSGKLEIVNLDTHKTFTLIDSLQRPVYAAYADINGDSLTDIIVCEFGNNYGALSWFQNNGDKKYSRHILRALPGAVKAQVVDMNNDGLPDIVALMAQGDEGMFIYYNQGNGTFSERRILQFSPAYGSNYFELCDFNHDGYRDILATNGDNGDYPPITKAYHGIRIYMNDGKNNFSEKKFLPVSGASKAVARDFDGDGDLDIASIAFFADYDRAPQESFIYWENKGDLAFSPYSFAEATDGRWLTLDADDLDRDGDIDIVLGNAKFPLGHIPEEIMKKWDRGTPSLIVLRNSKK